ncbi:hypothetical protein PIB30_109056, partial [Stylosanthes scabra]|nr:hypothetical protein [Stylosanthes scabra]
MDQQDETQSVLPSIPDDIMLEIFARSDAKTVGRDRLLFSPHFVSSHLNHTKQRSASTFVHFGMEGPRAIGSWVLRFNMQAGNHEL